MTAPLLYKAVMCVRLRVQKPLKIPLERMLLSPPPPSSPHLVHDGSEWGCLKKQILRLRDWPGGNWEEGGLLHPLWNHPSILPSFQLGHVFWYLFPIVLCLSFQEALVTKGSRTRKDTCHSPIIKIAEDYEFWEYQGSTNNTCNSTQENGNGESFSLICLSVSVIILSSAW